MKIEGTDRVVNKLQARVKQAQDEHGVSVIVGYTQNYALKVHENLDMRHAPGTFAKFLEMPARIMAYTIGLTVAKAYKRTKDLARSLYVGGLELQRASQQIVPVDTGALRASAFTKVENEL